MTTRAVRTPEERFEGLPGFAFRPSFREALGLRLAHLDEGAGPPVLFLHADPCPPATTSRRTRGPMSAA